MDQIETIRTYYAVPTGIWDRSKKAEVIKEVEGYAFRCKVCGAISLNLKQMQLHQHLTPKETTLSQPRAF